jgi:hypothetical protein
LRWAVPSQFDSFSILPIYSRNTSSPSLIFGGFTDGWNLFLVHISHRFRRAEGAPTGPSLCFTLGKRYL